MHKRHNDLWTISCTWNTLILIGSAILINTVSRLIVKALGAPFWLDTLGTCLAAVIGGPIVGIIAGVIQNFLFGLFFQSITMVYFFCQILVGLFVGVLFYYGTLRNFNGILMTGFVLGLMISIVCTPINLMLNGGATVNDWGDELFDGAVSKGMPLWAASILSELVVEIPDKILTIILTAVIYNALPEKCLDFLRGKIPLQIRGKRKDKDTD